MPIKSKAQRRKFAELLVDGKITPETFEEWNRGAGGKELPERLHPKKVATGTRGRAKTAKTTNTAASRTRKRTAATRAKTARKAAKRR